ncbi:phenylpyruvate tautomerase PptA (4-oxalocrotonate tautomerase family) [Methylobacterium sp. BE186]|uniref:tautomerase family protein n=1 Tax=Methylobacterium sp. BE186 TaxID=2817715 RepID=UPI0028644947|nr:tautomerase family protein [Methylobacterium sp. BE186]MDR7037278.1 phenylpyruvate tautomerase PptA (4-oxalocrotonate tautomerase family) [Methylobacterium sp. BE186]
MPTYTVKTSHLDLTAAQRQQIATAITDAHSEATGAPGYLAQVFFEAAAAGLHFIGGRPNGVPHVFVHGLIRAGRTAEQKRALIEAVGARVGAAAGIGREDIWVYVQDIAAEQMIEFGRILPEPGREAEWRRGFSPEKIGDFERAGVAL